MGFVKPGQGPEARADLAAPGFAYNGEEGGRVFSWYRKGIFTWLLQQMGYTGRDPSKCSERQCMEALLATSENLRLFPMETAELRPFAGPQYYPHFLEKARLDANKKPAKSGEAKSAGQQDASDEEKAPTLDEELEQVPDHLHRRRAGVGEDVVRLVDD